MCVSLLHCIELIMSLVLNIGAVFCFIFEQKYGKIINKKKGFYYLYIFLLNISQR